MPLTSFVVATLALNLAPGPDMTYVAARSLGQGRRAGMISGLEIAAGCVVHVMAAAAGVAQADAIRVLGAGCEVLGAVPGAWCWVPCLGAGCVPCLALNAAARRRRH